MSKQTFVTDFMWKPNWPLYRLVLFLFFNPSPPPRILWRRYWSGYVLGPWWKETQ